MVSAARWCARFDRIAHPSLHPGPPGTNILRLPARDTATRRIFTESGYKLKPRQISAVIITTIPMLTAIRNTQTPRKTTPCDDPQIDRRYGLMTNGIVFACATSTAALNAAYPRRVAIKNKPPASADISSHFAISTTSAWNVRWLSHSS